MKLTFKLVFTFLLANIVLAVVYGYLSMQQEERLFHETTSAEVNTLGSAMGDVLADAWQSTGPQKMLMFVRNANSLERHMRIRWVWFDAQAEGSREVEFSPSAPRELLTTITIEQHREIESSDPDGTPYLRIYWPVTLSIDRKGGLEFSRPLQELNASKREILYRTELLIGGMVLLSGILAAYLGIRLVGKPLEQLIEKTRRVAAGDLRGPVHITSHDELAELGESLNRMCDQLVESQTKIREETAGRVSALEQLRHADRLKTVGRLASGIAHELGTPLNVVSGRAGLIASGKLTSDEIGQSAAAIRAEVDKMTKIMRQLLDFARTTTPHKAAVDLRQVVDQTVDMLRPVADKRNVQLGFARNGEAQLAELDAGQMQQVLTNLVINAIQAMPAGGTVDITIGRRVARPPDGSDDRGATCYAIDIRDQGVGIAEENLQHLFEPFFTTKEVGEGTGLGLSIAYGIMQEHGGWIDVSSRPGAGSCFTIFLPAGAES